MGDIGSHTMPQVLTSHELCSGWAFKQTDDASKDAWLSVKKVPSTVQQDLLDHKKYVHTRPGSTNSCTDIPSRIPDPFVGFNEIKTEWVGKKSWTYRSKFQTPTIPEDAMVVLAFDGLDTFADVRLNGKTILRSDNMFLRHRIDITHAIQAESNDLEIEFDSALLKARDIEKQHPDHKYVCFNGDPARLAVRKAQCHWGWDWGPIIMCAGIWRPVRLEVYHARIADIRTEQAISRDYKSVTVNVKAEVEGGDVTALEAHIKISLEGKAIKNVSASVAADGSVSADLVVDAPSLWMPNGSGEQKLYDVEVSVSAGHDELHSDSRRIGIRKVELVQDPDQSGKSFYFRINGVDIFCGGSCWIPTDSILTNITPARLKAWIELLVPANQKMIRWVLTFKVFLAIANTQ